MALIPSQILRVAILLSYFSILCNYKAIDMPAHQTYGGSWKFLTFIDLVIQAVFFGVCVLTDLSSLLTKGSASMEQERQLRKLIGLRDWMMAVLAFPVGVFVVTMFWTLYLYDRDLIYPRLLDNFIPQWLNHGMVSKNLMFSFFLSFFCKTAKYVCQFKITDIINVILNEQCYFYSAHTYRYFTLRQEGKKGTFCSFQHLGPH